MANISLQKIGKTYPGDIKAVIDFNLEIHDKEFIVFVGPSGCGKSTTLRMIAGLEEITEGELYIDGILMNNVEPKDRNIAMVFQNYALYPYMTVYENMAFSLKLRKYPKREIDQKVRQTAEILDITPYLNRKPKNLSGGQRQRVALGRAIVRDPKVFLLDEPLSNLDAKMRTTMRTELIKLHKKLQTTFVYVTHDQVEAMTMGSRIVVMKDGYIQQIDTPQNLYFSPVNSFVAGFIGTPQMNFITVSTQVEGDDVFLKFGHNRIKLHPKVKANLLETDIHNKQFTLGIRPEDISFSSYDEKSSDMKGIVKVCEKLGNEILMYCELNGKDTDLIVRASSRSNIESDDKVNLIFNTEFIHLFDFNTGNTVLKRR